MSDNLVELQELLDEGWRIENSYPMGGAGNGDGYVIYHCTLMILEK